MQKQKNKNIRFVFYADPPAAATASICNDVGYDLITTPGSWSKDIDINSIIITDKVCGRKSIGKIIAKSWNRIGGLLFVAEMPLKYVINQYGELEAASLCCCSRHYTRKYPYQKNTLQLIQAVPFGFITQSDGGCNPAAYNYFPQAKLFNKYVEKIMLNKYKWTYYKSDAIKKNQFLNRPRITQRLIDIHFPRINFSNNELLEDIMIDKIIY